MRKLAVPIYESALQSMTLYGTLYHAHKQIMNTRVDKLGPPKKQHLKNKAAVMFLCPKYGVSMAMKKCHT